MTSSAYISNFRRHTVSGYLKVGHQYLYVLVLKDLKDKVESEPRVSRRLLAERQTEFITYNLTILS